MDTLLLLNFPNPLPFFSVHSQTTSLSWLSHHSARSSDSSIPSPTLGLVSALCVCFRFYLLTLWDVERVHTTRYMWRTEDNLQVSVFTFYHVGSGDVTQVVRLGGIHLYLLSHLFGPGKAFIILAFPVLYSDTSCGFNFIFPMINVIEHLFMCFSANHNHDFLCKQYAYFNGVIYPIIKFWQFIFLYIQIPSPLLYTWHANVLSLIFSILSSVSCKKHEFLKVGYSPICYWLWFCHYSVKSLSNSKILDVMQCPDCSNISIYTTLQWPL